MIGVVSPGPPVSGPVAEEGLGASYPLGMAARDLLVALRAPQLWLMQDDESPRALMDRFLDEAPSPVPVTGGYDESSILEQVASGDWQALLNWPNAPLSGGNLTAIGGVAEPVEPYVAELDEDRILATLGAENVVAVFTSDGDNLGFQLSRGFWEDGGGGYSWSTAQGHWHGRRYARAFTPWTYTSGGPDRRPTSTLRNARRAGPAQDGRTRRKEKAMGTESFQITPQQAELYEERFVPALFAHWVDATLDAVPVRAGQDVLDVACGTGIVTRQAVQRVGAAGTVTGLDLNPAMLDVAARVVSGVTWTKGDVAALPFDDDSFDVVTCQAAAMFFPDLTGALREMARVTRPGGSVAVQVFDLLENQPAYGPWVFMVARHAGEDALRMLGTYWVHGDRDLMRKRCAAAGLRVTAIHDHVRPAAFSSVEAMVRTEVNATPLATRLTHTELDTIIADSYPVFEPFHSTDGEQLTFPVTGYVLVATPDSYVAVEAAVRDYIDGWHAGDAQRMERSLHDDLVKRTVVNDESTPNDLRLVTKARMVELTRNGGAATPGARAEITVHDVEGGIATAQVATAEYLDYLHLARVHGTWQIVHDLFRRRD